MTVFAVAAAACQVSHAADFLWNAAAPGANNWTDPANWSPTGTPGTPDNAIFGVTGTGPDAFTVNNIVNANQTITGLTYNNATSGAWHVTQISAPNKLTVSGNFTVGGLNVDGSITSVAMTGDGTFEADGNNFKVGNAGASSTSTLNATLDMSGLSTFIYNAPFGTWIVAGSGGDARGGGVLNLACVSNNITVGTINFNTGSGNNSGFHSLIQLGGGTNIFNVDSFVVCQTKAQFANVQFLNTAPATAGLRIRGTNGAVDDNSRADITLGDRNNSGGAGTDGEMLFNGHPVDIKADTLLIGQDRSTSSGTSTHFGTGMLQYDTGVLDATTINMAICTTTRATSTANGTLTVGANGTLIVGTGGITVGRSISTTAANANLNIFGTAFVSNSIVKGASTAVANIDLTGGKLTMTSGVIGTPDSPIDNLTLATTTLTLAADNSSTNIVVSNFNPVDTANVINFSSMPVLTGYPSFIPVIAYSANIGGGSVSLGTLPGTFKGYLTNDTSVNSIVLVVTNGPAPSKIDTWTGSVNGTWDTSTLNWTTGSPAAYAENDSVIFDDSSTRTNITFSTTHTPLGMLFNNASVAYTLGGTGKISGETGLTNSGSGSVTLAASGGDNFSGGIVVNAGTVVLDDANSAITGPLTIVGGATFQIGKNDSNGNILSPIANDGTLIFNRADNLSLNTPITGFGSLVKIGNGVLTLNSANAGFGDTTVTKGTLALAGNATITNSPNVNVGGATLDLSAVNSGITTLNILNLTNATVTLGTTNLAFPLNANFVSMSGTANTINVTALPNVASYPATITLVKTVSGVVGYNAVLGTLPAATPAFVGSLSLSPDQTAIQLTLTSGPSGTRPYVSWSGADVVNLNTNWTDAQNWQTPGVPGTGEIVLFNNNGAQSTSALNTPGGGMANFTRDFINNIVDDNFTLSTLVYTNLGGFFHNTYIKSGKVLSITNTTFNVGGIDVGATAQITAVTIAGTNATLSYNNTNGNVQVWNGSSSSVANNRATLDLSALDTFNATASRFLVGANINQIVNRASGIFYLAKTNSLTAAFQTTGSDAGTGTGNAGIVVGDANSNAGADSSLVLGLANTISADTINIGRQKANGHLNFNPIYANIAPYPSVTFQGFSGSRVGLFEVGNGAGNTGTTTLSADATLNGGIVNASIDVLNVGRGSGGSSGSGNITGRLSFDAGTINANTVNIGLQPVTGSKVGIGVVGVSSNTVIGTAANLVAGSINLGLAGGGTGAATTSGTLNITNGTVTANTIVAGTNSVSAINVIGGRLNVATTIGSLTAPLGTLNLSPLNTPDNSNTVVQLPASATPAAVVNNLTFDGLDSTTNRISISSIAPVTVPAELPLIQYTSITPLLGGNFNIGLGTLPAGYSGYLTNDTTISAIALVVTTAPTVTTAPSISKITISGGNIVISGTNNVGGSGTYHVLTSTNLNAPLANWSVLSTGSFESNGSFNSTNAIDPTKPSGFYILQVP